MKDKVQKIREEVERLFKHVKDSNFESDSGAFYYFKDLLDFIDSLQEESKQKFKIGDRIKFKGVHDENVVRTITDIQKYDDGSCMYIFADGSLHSVGNNEIELVEESVREELEEAAKRYSDNEDPICTCEECLIKTFKTGAMWQKEKMMVNATKVTVHIDAGGYPYIPQMELYDYDNDVPLAKEGDKYKVILIKED